MSVYLESLIINLYFSLKFFLSICQLYFSYFFLDILFPTFQLYIILCLYEMFFVVHLFSTVTNITKTSLSLTTLTPSAVLPTHIQLILFEASLCTFIFSLFHITKDVRFNKFQLQ